MHSTSLTFGLNKDGSPNAIFDGLDRLVCSFPQVHLTATGGNDIRKGSPYTQEVQLANARLFATAPELLKELNDTLATLRGCFQTVNVINRIESIRAAITKATTA